jgi:hypothetical protein
MVLPASVVMRSPRGASGCALAGCRGERRDARPRLVGVEAAPIVRASSARFSAKARRAPARTRRLACPNAAVAFSSQNGDLGGARARVVGDLGDEPPVERGLGVDRLVLQQQAQRAGLADRRGKRRDAEVGVRPMLA